MTETPDLRWFEGIARPKCIQCGKCALVCPHAVIRMKVYEPAELAGAPAGDPPGSRVISAEMPFCASALANARAWVDFPAPSPPSNVMNLPAMRPT